ncbi:Cytochrome b561 [invertebrate metagenome]|uniref:Cytochrome b561 n=1 Tax=invertebrate metagenome TaxID=1711999 RepID=A0A2H9TC81_9ZZZZ
MDVSVRYALPLRYLHWIMAILIIGLLCVGFYMEGLPRGEQKFFLMGWHKSFGFLVLLLIGLRIIVRLLTPVPPREQNRLGQIAFIVHFILYLMMVLMPFSGMLMSWAGGYGISFFSLFSIPGASEKMSELGNFSHEVHEVLGYIFAGLIIFHGAGFLYQQFIRKDNVLNRIRP